MKFIESVRGGNLWPLGEGGNMVLGDQFIGGKTLRHWQELYAPEGAEMAANAWVAPVDWEKIKGGGTLVTEEGDVLGAVGDGARVMASGRSRLIMYPWDLLFANEQVVENMDASLCGGEVSEAANVEGALVVGEGTRVLPGVFVEGNVVIGKNCKVGPNCYIRGNTAIGDDCHIGQGVEVKNSLIGHRVCVGHLSYVGDSVLGNDVNLGAGTVISNYRHDGASHHSMVAGELLDTGRVKFGAILGDGVHTGINTSIYPGRKLGSGATTRPAECVERDLLGE